jgi:hypothetical protein
MFASLPSRDTQQVLFISFLCLVETIDTMLFPPFKSSAALLALSASSVALAQTTSSSSSSTNTVSYASSAQVTSSSASIGTVLLNGTQTT